MNCTRCTRPVEDLRYRRCVACRTYLRSFMQRYRGTRHTPLAERALAWLRVAPHTPRQLATLLNISPGHASALVLHLRQKERIAATAPIRHAGTNWYCAL